MQDYGKLETWIFRGPLFISKNYTREQLLKINHKYGFRPKYFNKDIDTLISGPPKTIFQHQQPKLY